MEAAARKMVEADKILVAHMIAIVGKVLPRMIAAVRMMVADHRLQFVALIEGPGVAVIGQLR